MEPIGVIMDNILILQEQDTLPECNLEEESTPLEIEGLTAKDIRAILQEFDNDEYKEE